MSPKHNSAARDLAGEIARIIDGRSVRPIHEGHLAVTSVVGDKVHAQVLATEDGTTVLAEFSLDVNVP